MNERRILAVFVLFLIGFYAAFGSEVKVYVNVSNLLGDPIDDARVNIGFRELRDGNIPAAKTAYTDDEGRAELVGPGRYIPVAVISKPGYYKTEVSYVRTHEISDGEFERKYFDSVNLNVVLKEKKNPLPLCAKRFEGSFPGENGKYAYDFEKGDWVGEGEGERVDIYFVIEFKKDSKGGSALVIEASFPNEGDGIVPFEWDDDYKSELKSSHYAPLDGYMSSWKYERRKSPGKKATENSSKTRGYYLRTRTELDENGNIISANYAKMYGELRSFVYYYNPEANDRNLEFDTRRNLLQSASRLTRVPHP